MKLRRTMKAQNPKKKEKERINNNNKEKRKGSRPGQRKDPGQARGRIPIRPKDMQQEEGSQSDQGICSKMYVHISNKKPLKNPTKLGIIIVTHGPSPWDPEWIVREKWFGR